MKDRTIDRVNRCIYDRFAGVVVKLVITSPCHGEGRGFESRPPRQILSQAIC